MNYLKITLLSVLCLLFITSCDDDDPEIVDPVELITTLNYTLTPDGGGTAKVFSFQDLDGDGGMDPAISFEALEANTVYSGTLELLDESSDPSESISDEVREEDDEHQVFFSSSLSDVSIEYNDSDGSGFPLGLSSTLTTGAAGSGTLTIILRHEPAKDASGVSDGDITNAGGETDIEVQFNLDVQ